MDIGARSNVVVQTSHRIVVSVTYFADDLFPYRTQVSIRNSCRTPSEELRARVSRFGYAWLREFQHVSSKSAEGCERRQDTLDVAKESSDSFPPLKSALSGVNTLIKHYEERSLRTALTRTYRSNLVSGALDEIGKRSQRREEPQDSSTRRNILKKR